MLFHLQNQEVRIKNQKKIQRKFSVFQFSFMATLSHWYQGWVKVAMASF